MEKASGKLQKLALIVVTVGLSNFVAAFWAGVPLVIVATAIGMLLVGLVMHLSSSKRSATYACIFVPPVAAMAVVLAMALLTGGSGAPDSHMMVIFLGGAMTVGPAIVYGGLTVILVRASYDHYSDRSFESFDSTLHTCGVWLLSVAALVTLIALAVAANSGDWTRVPWVVLCGASMLTGAGAIVTSMISRQRRKAWFARVLAGEVPGWRVVAWDDERLATPLRPLFAGGGPVNAVVVRNRAVSRGGPFRSADELAPYALVFSRPGRIPPDE